MSTSPNVSPPSDGLLQRGAHYDSHFFQGIAGGSQESALVILGMLFEIYQPDSVFDLGCGQGLWLAAAGELGCGRLVGVDGPWVNPAAMLCKTSEFRAANFEEAIDPGGRYDLALSVEVAEHVSLERSRAFVATLCAASDVVVFSAAITQQGGTYHLNEQWQSFWAAYFHELGYECLDFFRPRVWTDRRVESWYRQNVLLYVKRTHPLLEEARAKSLLRGPLDVVHPDIYVGNLENYQRQMDEPTLKLCGQLLFKWARRQLKKITG